MAMEKGKRRWYGQDAIDVLRQVCEIVD
jgi:hypothetical protein